MTWQPPPQQPGQQQPAQWPPAQYPVGPNPAGAYQPGPYPQPPRRPGLPVVRWIAAAVAFCLLLTGSYVVHRTVLAGFIGGASSPEDAVLQAISAIEAGDLTRLGLLVPPDEVAGLSDVSREMSRIMAEIGEDSDTAAILTETKAFSVQVDDLELATEEEQDGLVKVSVENADITASFDPDELPSDLRDRMFPGVDGYQEVEITVRGSEVTADGDEDTFEVGGREQPPFVMTVERDGAWYVSPLFSYLQYITEYEGYDTSPAPTTPGSDSPEEAAEALVQGIADAFDTQDVTSVAEHLAGVEGKALFTYQDLINGELFDRSGAEVSVDEASFEVLSVDGNTARVKPVSFSFTYEYGSSFEETVSWDGECFEVDNTYGSGGNYCTDDPDTLGPFAPMIDELGYVVAVRADGGWKISASRTITSMVADVLSWVGDKELPVMRALVRQDFSELVDNVDSVASIDINDSATVDMEPINDYIGAGYVLVEIDNPMGDRFSVYCEPTDNSGGCDVAAIVTPDGDTDSAWYAGGEDGTYHAIIVATVGEMEVMVEEY